MRTHQPACWMTRHVVLSWVTLIISQWETPMQINWTPQTYKIDQYLPLNLAYLLCGMIVAVDGRSRHVRSQSDSRFQVMRALWEVRTKQGGAMHSELGVREHRVTQSWILKEKSEVLQADEAGTGMEVNYHKACTTSAWWEGNVGNETRLLHQGPWWWQGLRARLKSFRSPSGQQGATELYEGV